MSLTSYRAAPPRVNGEWRVVSGEWRPSQPPRVLMANGEWPMIPTEPFATRHQPFAYRVRGLVLGRPGDDLLSRVLRHSTIGAEAFNGRVRDGIGFWAPRSDHRTGEEQEQANFEGSGQWAVGNRGSVPQLPTAYSRLPVFLVRLERTWITRAIKPIERLVLVSSTRCRAYTSSLSTWSSSTALIGSTRFEVGFPLRCLQRLSRPYIATLHCGWRHNSSTRGTSIPVLSY